MIRHIFMGTFKEGIDNETKQKELADMQAMKEKIPGNRRVANRIQHRMGRFKKPNRYDS